MTTIAISGYTMMMPMSSPLLPLRRKLLARMRQRNQVNRVELCAESVWSSSGPIGSVICMGSEVYSHVSSCSGFVMPDSLPTILRKICSSVSLAPGSAFAARGQACLHAGAQLIEGTVRDDVAA